MKNICQKHLTFELDFKAQFGLLDCPFYETFFLRGPGWSAFFQNGYLAADEGQSP